MSALPMAALTASIIDWPPKRSAVSIQTFNPSRPRDCLKMLTSGQTAHHEATHDGVDQSLAGLAQPLVVFAEPAALYQPAKGPFHYPAVGQHPSETPRPQRLPVNDCSNGCPDPSGLGGMVHHCNTPTQMSLNPHPPSASVSLIHPDVTELGELLLRPCQQQGDGSSILKRSAMHFGFQYQTQRVHQQMTFAAVHLFSPVIATDTARHGSLDGLAVQDACAGLGIPPHLGPKLFPESSMNGLPGVIQPPEPEVVVGGSPRRKFMGEEPPLASGTKDVEDGVHDLPQGMQPRSTSWLDWGQEWYQALPLWVGQVCEIRSSFHNLSVPTLYAFFRQSLSGQPFLPHWLRKG